MDIYTIGFTGKKAEEFFEPLKDNGVKKVIDIRLNNTSQLASFSMKKHLPYLLHQICGIPYVHRIDLAPTEEILDNAKSKGHEDHVAWIAEKNGKELTKKEIKEIIWKEYEVKFIALLKERKIENLDPDDFDKACLLCSEKKADKCHRRLVAEYMKEHWDGVNIIHL